MVVCLHSNIRIKLIIKYLLTKSTKLINELFDNYVSNYLTSYGSPYLTEISDSEFQSLREMPRDFSHFMK